MTLRDLRCAFTALVAELIEEAQLRGFECALGEVVRGQAQADANAASGAGITHSLHLLGLAVDLLLYRDGTYLTRTEDYAPLGVWWEAQHELARWGGRFKRADGNHFSMEFEGRR